MKRLLVVVAVVAALLLATGYAFRTELATRAMRGVVAQNLQTDRLEEAFTEGVDAVYQGRYRVGRDGTLVLLPPGGESIETEDLL
jgi:hypothetical protein